LIDIVVGQAGQRRIGEARERRSETAMAIVEKRPG